MKNPFLSCFLGSAALLAVLGALCAGKSASFGAEGRNAGFDIGEGRGAITVSRAESESRTVAPLPEAHHAVWRSADRFRPSGGRRGGVPPILEASFGVICFLPLRVGKRRRQRNFTGGRRLFFAPHPVRAGPALFFKRNGKRKKKQRRVVLCHSRNGLL